MKRYKFILMLLLATIVLPIKAQNVIHPKIAGPNGLWVNSYNGVLFFGQTDLETQNTAMPMVLRFYYNSSCYATNYGYGLGFSLGYEMRYTLDDKGNVTILTGDGRRDTFKRYGNDYEAPAGVFSILTKSDGDVYTLQEKDGTIYTFGDATHKKLTAITDRQGNKTELTYDNASSLLTQIKDDVNHTITLTYTDSLLTQASASFHNGSIKYEYDSKKRLKKRTDAMGYSTLYAYTDENRIERITDANGHKTMIAYSPAGMCSRIKTDVTDKSIRYEGDKTVFIDYTEPKNIYSYFRWDSIGRVVEKVGLCCGIQSRLEYDDDDNVVRRIDANGNVTSYTYDNRGNMLSMTDALGNTERFTYDADFNQVTSFQDKNGNTYQFSYDGKGNLTSFDGPAGFSNAFTYNDKGWLMTSTDANNGVTRATYNDDGTIANVMNAAGHITSYTYDQCGNITAVTDPRGNSTSYKYDDNNRITSQSDALDNTISVSYDKVGNIVRVLDAKNQITAYTYDALGNVLSMVNPKGGTYTFTYDGKGQLLSVTNPEGETVTQEWNEKGKLQSQINGEGERTTYDYDAKGNLISVFQSNGNVLNYFYDQVDRISQISDNIGVIANYTYDANGNRLTVTDGLNRTMTYTYDGLNRRTTEALPSGATTTYVYDGNSNLLTITDANGNATTYTYSSLNQQISHTDALNAKTQFEYDANGNLTKAIDANGNATTYTYDVLNRNTDISFANGATLQYGYDELGRVISSKDRANNQFKYAYDVLGNLLSKSYPDGSIDKYSYDGVSRMLSAVNNDATVKFTYDHANRLLSETLNGQVTGYSYDVAAGKRTLTYPSGMKVVEQLNARDLITSILQNGEEVVTMAYNVAGQKTEQTYANGITTTYGYNDNGWLSSIEADHSVMNLEMTYDAIGNMTERKDLLNADHTENYEYDVISQLISFKRGTTIDNSYEFDLLGNRVKMLENGVATNYTANNVNAYTNITGPQAFTPEYDENGNLLRDANNKYAYDFNNRLSMAGSTEYKYDALGRRITKGDTYFYYVGDQMVEEMSSDITTSYIYGNNINEFLLMDKNNNKYYYHTNVLGSPMSISEANGNIVEKISYDVYGKPTLFDKEDKKLTDSSIGNSIMFTGYVFDEETELYGSLTRFYQSSIAKYMQKDPMQYIGGMNDTRYVNNNPIILIDVLGMIPTDAESSLLAKAAYEDNSNMKVDGWERLANYDFESSGLRGSLFRRGDEYAFAFSGTNFTSWNDWKNNFQQAFGFNSLQYNQAVAIAKYLDNYFGDCELTFIGHSLGGGLASAASRATGRDAITFNAAALNKRYNGGMNSNIKAFITNGDILNNAQGIIGQTAEGTHISKPGVSPKKLPAIVRWTNPFYSLGYSIGSNLRAGIDNHSLF